MSCLQTDAASDFDEADVKLIDGANDYGSFIKASKQKTLRVVFTTYDSVLHNGHAVDPIVRTVSRHVIMKSLTLESCCMQQMQHHKDTNIPCK